jgi:hypothetical protein
VKKMTEHESAGSGTSSAYKRMLEQTMTLPLYKKRCRSKPGVRSMPPRHWQYQERSPAARREGGRGDTIYLRPRRSSSIENQSTHSMRELLHHCITDAVRGSGDVEWACVLSGICAYNWAATPVLRRTDKRLPAWTSLLSGSRWPTCP